MPCYRNRILVVDDDADIRDALCELLEDEGYTTTSAENGSDALARLRSSELPCAILLDLMMPVMDGLDFRAQQQCDPALESIPVVVISAAAEARRVAGAMHAAGFLPKPIQVPILINTVERLCPLPGGAVPQTGVRNA
jgi:CheY-like chemotaxis protein